MKIQKLQNVAVTNNCVIISRGTILRDSCVGEEYFKKYQSLKFRLKYFFPFFSCSKKTHILITDEWSKNYCHWLWEALSKLAILKKEFPDAILVLPKNYLKIDYMMKSLAAFGFNNSNIKVIPKKSHLRVKNLAFIPCINLGIPGYYDFLKLQEVPQTLVSYHQENLKTNFGDKIYISRNNPKNNVLRKVENEEELRAMLTKHGFKTVYMEKFSFLEQISIASNAKFVVASHGAGIANLLFSGTKCTLFELLNKAWPKSCFAEMCERAKINYQRFECEEIQNSHSVMDLRNVRVNVDELEQKLTRMSH